MTETKKTQNLIEKILSQSADPEALALVEALVATARQAGANDLLIDLHDADEISPDGIEFAMVNNGCADPR